MAPASPLAKIREEKDGYCPFKSGLMSAEMQREIHVDNPVWSRG